MQRLLLISAVMIGSSAPALAQASHPKVDALCGPGVDNTTIVGVGFLAREGEVVNSVRADFRLNDGAVTKQNTLTPEDKSRAVILTHVFNGRYQRLRVVGTVHGSNGSWEFETKTVSCAAKKRSRKR